MLNPMTREASPVRRRKKRGELERELLRALCQEACGGALFAEASARLAGYRFTQPEHQLVFDALRSIARDPASRIRERLQVRLNNLGFPEIDLEFYCEQLAVSPRTTRQLIRRLTGQE